MGSGGYPTIETFDYEEELSFEFHGEPWLAVSQRAWSLDEGATLHMERGFLRPGPLPGVELVLAHPIGVVEVAHGMLSGTSFEVATEPGLVGHSETGLEVVGLVRRYGVQGDAMEYRTEMATATSPMALHLTAELRRAG